MIRPIRVVLLDNHLSAIRAIVYKRYNTLPLRVRSRFTSEDLVHDCVAVVRLRQQNFDPARSKFITFVYLVVHTYLSKRLQYEQRACRYAVEVSIDKVHCSTNGGVMNDVDLMDASRRFMRMYALLSSRLRCLCRRWFLAETFPVNRVESYRLSHNIIRRAMQEADMSYDDMKMITACPDIKAALLVQALEFEDMGDDE